ncbi:MAG: hypothetical protein J5835_06665 [Bacteroidales bacterium]|nr:hypothetical protein [Bacteroidales bacterium]
MNLLLKIAGITACIATVSCNREPVPVNTPYEPGEIVFTADNSFSASITTKTSEIDNLQSTGFYASATTGTSTEVSLWNSYRFTYSKDTEKYSGGRYWPVTNNGIHFYASNVDLAYSADGCYVEGVSATTKDVVCAYLEEPAWGVENALTFEHIFARIGSVKINAPDGYTVSAITITLKPYVSGNYNLKTGEWSELAFPSVSSVKTIASSASILNDNNLWIVPGTYTLTANYTLTKGSGDGSYSETFSKTADVDFLPGKITTIETTLPEGNATDIVFSVSVTPWVSNPVDVTFQ